ncbi:MAG: DNA internalization-related competence protein ComEC/Rec2 [Anaerotardibacter sp.]
MSAHDFSGTEVVVEITSDKKTGDYGTTAQGRVISERKPCLYTLNLKSVSSEDCAHVYYGNKLLITASYSSPTEKNSEYFAHNNLVGTLYVTSVKPYSSSSIFTSLFSLRQAFSEYLGTIAQEDESLLYKALLLGERTNLFNSDFYQEVKCSGLAHLVAISGAHLVIVASVLLSLAKTLKLPRTITYVGITLLIILYVVFSGFSLSCLRAATMSIVAYLSYFGKRRSHSLSGLGLVISFFIALEPTVVFSLSFSLSVLATLGIILFSPLLKGWLTYGGIVKPAWLIDPLIITLCATVLTAGLSCSEFSQFSVIAPLSNIFATFYIPILMGAGFLGCFLGVLFHTSLFATILTLIATPFCTVISFCAALPFSTIPVYLSPEVGFVLTLSFAILGWITWPNPHFISLKKGLGTFGAVILLVCVLLVGQGQPSRIVMLDIGQGDAFLIQNNGKTVLIDTGNQDTKLLKELARARVYSLDAVVITHPDDDHCGSLSALKGIIPVKHLYVASGLDEVEDEKVVNLLHEWRGFSETGIIEYLSYHNKLSLGTIELRVVSPTELKEEGGNQDSICFFISIDCDKDGTVDTDAFFVGDAESETLEEVIKRENIDSIDILKVGHHGSKKALNSELLKILKPKIALISVGEGNRFGHPSNEVLSLLEEANTKILRTDKDGMVICNFTAQGFSVETLG